MKLRMLEIARAARSKRAPSQAKLKEAYRKLLNATGGLWARRSASPKRSATASSLPLARTGVVRQHPATGGAGGSAPKARKDGAARAAGDAPNHSALFAGDTHAEGKIVSLFERQPRLFAKARPASQPNSARWSNCKKRRTRLSSRTRSMISGQRLDLLIAAIETHQATLGCTPRLVAADAGFYSAKNEAAAKAKGVKRVCIPNRSTKSPERKREQKKRWFRNGQKWRTGCEGRISVVKRRHGLDRSRYKGDAGMQRWVGLGVIADNLINISRVMASSPRSNPSPPNPTHFTSSAGITRRVFLFYAALARPLVPSPKTCFLRRKVAKLVKRAR